MGFNEYFNSPLNEMLSTSGAYLDITGIMKAPSSLPSFLNDPNKLKIDSAGKKYKIKAGKDFNNKVTAASKQDAFIKSLYFGISKGNDSMAYNDILALFTQGFQSNFGPEVGKSIPLTDYMIIVPA
jgi:hypothetical protein